MNTHSIHRFLKYFFGLSFVLSLVFMMSCSSGDENPQPDLYEIPGVYTFKKAVLQTTVTIAGIPFNKGKEITDEMAKGLLAEAPCDDPNNGAVELKSDMKLFFSCLNETNEEQAGTWSVNGDTTSLSLNLASPPLPSALQLKLSNVEIDKTNDVISGNILNFPLTPDLIAGFLPSSLTQAQIDAIISQLPPATMVDVDIEFEKAK